MPGEDEDVEVLPAAWLIISFLHTALCYDERQKGVVYAAGGIYALLRSLHRFIVLDDYGLSAPVSPNVIGKLVSLVPSHW